MASVVALSDTCCVPPGGGVPSCGAVPTDGGATGCKSSDGDGWVCTSELGQDTLLKSTRTLKSKLCKELVRKTVCATQYLAP